jgi:hypothetical protein
MDGVSPPARLVQTTRNVDLGDAQAGGISGKPQTLDSQGG